MSRTVIERSGHVSRVVIKSGQTISEAIQIGQYSYGALEIRSADTFNPTNVQALVNIQDVGDYDVCPDSAGAAIAAVSLLNKKALIPLEAFYFKGLKLKFSSAPAADTEIFLSLRG